MALTYKVQPDTQLHILPELLLEHFGYKTDGCFVEVGAYDGKSYSHTWGLSKAGWKGLYIEPLRKALMKCEENHASNPLIEYENCCASDYDGEGILYLNDDTSTTLLNKFSREWGASEKHKVPIVVKTMNTILTEHNWPKSFDVCSIDVEEAEHRVLFGFNLSVWRPKMLIIELHELVPEKNWRFKSVLSMLAGFGYRRIYGDEINTIFLL